MGNKLLEGANTLGRSIALSIEHLLPGATVSVRASTDNELEQLKSAHEGQLRSTFHLGKTRWKIFFPIGNARMATCEITRPSLAFSSAETEILGKLHWALPQQPVDVSLSSSGLELPQQIALGLSFELVLVAKMLREARTQRFGVSYRVLRALQDLTFATYENRPCTSGFVYTTRIGELVQKLDSDQVFRFEKFGPIRLQHDFFSHPASHRYVDGQNAFYLIDQQNRIHGVLRSVNAHRHSVTDRAIMRHLEPILAAGVGRTWVAYAGVNRDVLVQTKAGNIFQWSRNHWKFRDYSHIRDQLVTSGCSDVTASQLLSVVVALSTAREGSVMLVRRSEDPEVPKVGSIDRSELARVSQFRA